MRVKKKEITKLCNKLSMKVDLPVEFNAEKCNLNFQSHIYQKKIYIYKTKTSTNAQLKVFVTF